MPEPKIAAPIKNDNKACIEHIEKYQELFDDMLDMVHIYDIRGHILFMNKLCYERLGYVRGSAKTCSWQNMTMPQQREDIRKAFSLALRTGQKVPLKLSFRTKNNREVLVSGHFLAMSEFGSLLIKGVFHEITVENKILQTQELYFDIVDYHTNTPSLDALYRKIFKKLHQILHVSDMMILSKRKNADAFSDRVVHCSERKTISAAERHAAKNMCKILAQDILSRNNAILVYEHGIKSILDRNHIAMDPFPTIWAGTQIPVKDDNAKVICFYSYDTFSNYNYSDLELLEFIGKQVSMAMERKFRDRQVFTQNARIHSMFESSTHQIWFVNRKGTLTAFNTNFSKDLHSNLGIVPVVGKYAVGRAAFLPPIRSNAKETMRIWREKYARAFRGHSLSFETCFANRRGEKIWKEIFLHPVYMSNGVVKEVSSIALDITSKKRSEMMIQKSEEKFRAIFESFQDLYFRFRREGPITMVSPSIQEITGWTPEEMIGKDICTFMEIPSSTASSCEGGLFSVLDKESIWKNVELIITSKQGKKLYCICNFRRLFRGKNHAALIEGVARDISQLKDTSEELRKAKETAEESLKIKQSFLANMSHEIRTPINGMMGMLSLLETDPLSGEQRNYVQAIKKSSETLLDILNDILNLSRIEAGKFNIQLRTVLVTDLLDKLRNLFEQQARANDTALVMHVSEEVPKHLLLDDTRLLQILSNLTSNAIKFSKGRGSINIAVGVCRAKGGQLMLRVDIKDNGVGISQRDMHLLFKKFSQVETSMKKKFRGAGLGLSISKHLVSSMRGEIGVLSTYEMGSTFWFTIPTHKAEPLAIGPENGETEKIEGSLAAFKPFILVVDDNEINLKVSSEILVRAGCRVKTSLDGHKAIALAQEHAFDLIFMDIQMPEKDGIETTKDIRALLSHVPPVIAITAYSMEEDRIRFLKQGMDDYISKPMRPHFLIEKVRHWMKKKKPVEAQKNGDVVHWKSLRDLAKHGGWKMVKEAFKDFHEELKDIRLSCQETMGCSDYKQLAHYLHKLKGSAGMMGLQALASGIEALEQSIKEKQYVHVPLKWKHTVYCMASFEKEYTSILKKMDTYDNKDTDS